MHSHTIAQALCPFLWTKKYNPAESIDKTNKCSYTLNR